MTRLIRGPNGGERETAREGGNDKVGEVIVDVEEVDSNRGNVRVDVGFEAMVVGSNVDKHSSLVLACSPSLRAEDDILGEVVVLL